MSCIFQSSFHVFNCPNKKMVFFSFYYRQQLTIKYYEQGSNFPPFCSAKCEHFFIRPRSPVIQRSVVEPSSPFEKLRVHKLGPNILSIMSPVHLCPININNLHCCATGAKGFLYGGGPVLLVGRANHLCRDRASQLNYLSKFVFVHMRGGPAVLGEISLFNTEISPRRAGNIPFSSQEGWKYSIFLPGGLALLGGLASQSSLHTTKGGLTGYFLDNISFHKLCLFMCRI